MQGKQTLVEKDPDYKTYEVIRDVSGRGEAEKTNKLPPHPS